MPNKPNDADAQIGSWNQELLFDRVKRSVLNRDNLDITLDQIRQVYVLLYPFIEQDFKHRDDLFNYVKKLKEDLEKQRTDFNTQLNTLTTKLNTHFHLSAAPGSPTGPIVQPLTVIQVKPLSSILTEDTAFTAQGSSHLRERVVGQIRYQLRKTNANSSNIKANKVNGRPGKKIDDMLYKDAKVFVPFDVGERDSVLDSKPNQVEGKGLGDL